MRNVSTALNRFKSARIGLRQNNSTFAQNAINDHRAENQYFVR